VPLQRIKTSTGENLAKDKNQVSEQADVNDLPESKRSLAGAGRGT
jgi:hypothetical protein